MSSLGKLFGGLWLVFVASYYFKYHTYYKPDPVVLRGFIFTLVAFTLLYVGIWFFQNRRKKETITLSAVRIVAGFFLTALLPMGIFYANLDQGTFFPDQKIVSFGDNQYALVDEGVQLGPEAQIQFVQGTTVINWSKGKGVFPPEIQALFTSPSVFSFLAGIAQSLGTALGIMLLLLVVFHNTGALALRRKEVGAFGFFESVGIGMSIAMAGLFLLGIVGQLTVAAAWGWFGILGIGSLVKSRLLWKAATQTFYVPLHLNKTTLATLIPVTALLILLAFNTVSMIRPLPVGFDSLILYHNTASLLTQYGRLIGGIAAYNYELLITWGLLLFQSKTAGLFVVYLGSLLAIGLLFETLRQKFGARNALWWTAFFVSLPMTSFLLHIDVKIDLPLLFFSLLAIHYAVKAAPHLKNKEGIRFVLLTGIFLGIAFGIKYTTAMLIGIVLAFWAYELWGTVMALGIVMISLAIFGKMGFWTFAHSFSENTREIMILVTAGIGLLIGVVSVVRKEFSWSKIKPFVLMGVILGTLMAPWLIKNGIENQSLTPQALLYGVNQNVDPLLKTLQSSPAKCPAIPTYNELSKYIGNFSGNSLQLPLRILWEVNINSGLGNNRITDISFIFLGLVVWVLWGWKKATHEDATLKRVTLFTGLYGFLWLLTSNAIIWYGMPVLVGIIWIYAEIFKKEVWVKGVLTAVLGLGMILIYAESGAQAEAVLYAGEVIDERIFKEQAFSGGEEVEAIVNQDEALRKNILWNGSFIQYLVKENDRRVLNDTYLDNFSCKLVGENPEQTLENIRASNIGYILYSTLILKVEADENGPLHQRFADFEAFANEYLILEVYRPKLQLYRVP